MARDYARIMTSIWRNNEFRLLAEAPQRAYLMLVTQPDISAAGVLALRVRRWADMASNTTAESLAHAFRALEAGRFIVVDWDAEELLIRSFIRWDAGFSNPKRRPVILRDASQVVSASITHHLVTEFKRCGIPMGPDWPPRGPDQPADSKPDSLSSEPEKISSADLGLEPFPQVNSLCDAVSTNHGVVDGYVSGSLTATLNPQPTTQKTEKTSKTAARPRLDQTSRPDVDQLCERLRADLTANEVKYTINARCRTAARLLLDRDHRALDEATELITWATNHKFWSGNILCMSSFRKQYDKLRIQKRNEDGRGHLMVVSNGYRPYSDPPDSSIYHQGFQ